MHVDERHTSSPLDAVYCETGFAPKHHYGVFEGVELHWVEIGDSTSTPPVVLLHGLSDCHQTWSRIAVELAKERRVLIPDLPGHGYSGHPDASYALGWHARVMAGWMEALEIELADVVGHSFGGGVAQMLLLECRDRIGKLALIASGGLGREIAFELRLASLPWIIEKLGQPFMRAGTMLALGQARNQLTRAQLDEIGDINAQRGSARAFARTVGDVINWRGQTRNFFQRAHEVADLPPIGLFWGDRDRVVPIAHAHELVARVGGIPLTVFNGCGHFPHHEAPGKVNAALRAFFAGLGS